MFISKRKIREFKLKFKILREMKLNEIPILWFYVRIYISSLIREKLGIYKNEPPKNSLRHDIYQLIKKKIRKWL